MKLYRLIFEDYIINNGVGLYGKFNFEDSDSTQLVRFRPGYTYNASGASPRKHTLQFISEDTIEKDKNYSFVFAHLCDGFFETIHPEESVTCIDTLFGVLKNLIGNAHDVFVMFGLGYTDVALVSENLDKLEQAYTAIKSCVSMAQIVAHKTGTSSKDIKVPKNFIENNYKPKSLLRNDNEVHCAYKAFRTKYNSLVKKKYAHKRVLGSVEDMLDLYNTVIDNEHSLPIKFTVGRFITSYFTCAAALIDYMTYTKGCQYICDNAGNRHRDRYVQYIEEATEEFKASVSDFLCGILKSDCNRWDDLTVPRTTVGGAIKLVLAYNQLLDDWDEAYMNSGLTKEQDIEETGFAYLVTSGGNDFTTHNDIFDYNHNVLSMYTWDEKTLHRNYKWNGKILKRNEEQENCGHILKRPILIKMPECSLYNDPKITQLRLAHEFFHKRGNRLRDKRYTAMYNSLNAVTTMLLTYRIGAQYLKTYLRFMHDNYYHRTTLRWETRNENNNALSFEDWRDLLCNGNEEECRNLRNYIVKKYGSVLSDTAYYLIINNLSNHKWVEDIENTHYKNEELLSQAAYVNCKENYKEELNNPKNAKRNAEKILDMLLKSIDSLPKIKMSVDKNLLDIDFRAKFANLEYCKNVWDTFLKTIETNELKPVDSLMGDKYFKRAQAFDATIKDWFKECYADYMALSAMGFTSSNPKESFLKYLFTHLYELRDPDLVFYNIDYLAVRFGILIQLFWKNLCWFKPEEIQAEIKDWYLGISKNADDKTANAYADKVMEKLKDLIERSKFYSEYTGWLKEYINDCYSAQNNLFESMLKKTQSITDIDFAFGKLLSIFRTR